MDPTVWATPLGATAQRITQVTIVRTLKCVVMVSLTPPILT
jgi:hypothetical protein